LYQIKTLQKEGEARAGYTVAIPLRGKKYEASFPAFPMAVRPDMRKSFLRNSFGVFSQTASALLIGLFFFNPVLDVYADEIPLIVPGENIAPVLIEVPPVIADETPPTETPPDEQVRQPADFGKAEGLSLPTDAETPSTQAKEAEAATSTEDVVPAPPEESTPEIIEESAIPKDAITPPETVSDEQGQTFPPAGGEGLSLPATTTEIIIESEIIPVAEEEDTASTTEAIEGEIAESPEVTETPVQEEAPAPETVREVVREVIREVIVERTPPAPVVNVIEKKYLFRENECARLDDGGFYCAPPEMASTTVASNDALPRVFVQNDGDKEIFFEDTNGKTKITDNDFDDDAPSYDKQSGLVAWHSLVKGRYQIMLSDLGTSTAKQLTDVSYNNTDPKVRGKSIVWQGWVENNWEIFYVKDVTTVPLAIQQITANEQPDMFPIISDGFITWQSFAGGSWRVFVYTIENGQISQISQPDAGRYENPRFALLFENRKENGEVETVGYDVVSGKEIPINAPHVPSPAVPTPGGEEDKAVPVPAGQTSTSTTAVKNPGKDDEGEG
jgi:hypothetical protein